MNDNAPEWAKWHRHFGEIIVSGDAGEVNAATEAAVTAIREGASDTAAKSAGKLAARRYRDGRVRLSDLPGGFRPAADRPGTASPYSPYSAPGRPRVQTAEYAEWPVDLAARLFAIPPRWGWRPANLPVVAAPQPAAPTDRPTWVEPPRPDTRELVRARSTAVSKLVWRIAFTVVVGVAFLTYRVLIQQKVQGYGGSATQVYTVVVLVAAGVLGINLLRAISRVASAGRAIREFEQPYLELRAAEKRRHEQAVAQWQEAARRHEFSVADAEHRADGPLWFPVHPASEPTRVDVIGGDPHRHGWASLLVTLGTSVLRGGHQVSLLDFTGHDVGGGLLSVAQARGLQTEYVDLQDGLSDADLLADLPPTVLADALAWVLTGRPDGGDQRYERALTADVIGRLIESLDTPVTFRRLAAGTQVLRQATPDPGVLSTEELTRLADQFGEFGRDEWTSKQLHLMASQLAMLDKVSPHRPGRPLWAGGMFTVVATAGARDDSKVLLDRLLVQLAEWALRPGGPVSGFLIVAGADHLGAATLTQLSEHARQAGVRLILMIDQTQGDLEKTLGTGGAVCVMKAYNHRDAGIAADFIGRDHKFVVSQVTLQVGKTFTDGGGDNFAAATTRGTSAKPGLLRERGRSRNLTNSRGHTWTAVRNWSMADSLNNSHTASRVYEFTVDPQEILGMPETAFILVDNSGQGRRIIMADCYPGICLLDRVALTPSADPVR